MILKDYQAQAIKHLEEFLQLLDDNSISDAFAKFWSAHDVNAPAYQNSIPHVPKVCLKVPTGGGKTFMATASLKVIFDAMPAAQSKVVVWLVPSETILTQTYKNLNDAAHPYHRRLAMDFDGKIAVYTKEQLLAAENFSPAEVRGQLSIFVLSYDSFRGDEPKKSWLKAYQQNGQLYQFAEQLKAEELLNGADKISLISVIRHYKPVIIVDESHHATTALSVKMLQDFNPRFILELTATPRPESNVIAYVPAAKLKANGMVKLPAIVYNRHTQEEVITAAINFRNLLERAGHAENIRPIVLFQAETQGKGERATFDKIKADLIENHNIPAEQIAIKTADINDLRNVDLMATDCPIRYIITINALKEGWDCPFAYILASLANRTSVVDVEQILGRILRRPFTKNFSDELLNMSYVLTSSADFRQTLDKIIVGLNAAGFGKQDYRATDTADDMAEQALQFSNDYPTEDGNIRSEEERSNMTEFHMREEFSDALDLLLPKFFYKENFSNLFGGVQDVEVSRDALCGDVTLADKDTMINFDSIDREIASFDVRNNEDSASYKKLSDADARIFLEYFDNLSPEGQIRQCVEKLTTLIDKRRKVPPTEEIRAYVKRIVDTFDRDRIRDAVSNEHAYAKKIGDKIDALLTVHAKKRFEEMHNACQIFTKPCWRFPATITPTKSKSWSNSLYEKEDNDINTFEWRVASEFTAIDNILWWHRNRSKTGFGLNGYMMNHYPDFIVKMKSGRVLLVETKGDDRDNSDSKLKLDLGKFWESLAGQNLFRYFMVFENKKIDDALNMEEFIATLEKI